MFKRRSPVILRVS